MQTTVIAKPQDIHLDVSRVGQQLTYLEDAQVGETIQFHYTGGSGPGLRTVLVQKVDSRAEVIEGITLERDGQYRRYSDNEATQIYVVQPFVSDEQPTAVVVPSVQPAVNSQLVRFDAARDAIAAKLTAEQITELYAKYIVGDDATVSYDANTGSVVVTPKPAVITVAPNALNIIKGANSVGVYLHPNTNRVGLTVFKNRKQVSNTADSTANDVLEALKTLLT